MPAVNEPLNRPAGPLSTARLDSLLSVQEVASILHVSVAWVYDHSDRKRPIIPTVRLGRAVRFRPDDVQAFIQEMTRRVA